MKKIENKSDVKIVENKVSLSHREISKNKLLFRLVNTKREKSKSFNIYEKAKFSTNIELAYNNSYRKIDIDYDTTFNNRFKKVNLLVDFPQYLTKEKKSLYLDLLNSNNKFIKENKVSSEIIENQNYFTKLISIVYEKCNNGVAFNVMSKSVDWEREDLFHLPLDILSDFLCKKITRNFIIRNDYGLYEYTVYLLKT